MMKTEPDLDNDKKQQEPSKQSNNEHIDQEQIDKIQEDQEQIETEQTDKGQDDREQNDIELDDNEQNLSEFEEDINYNHQCYICDKTFSANSNLNRHLRKIHKENVQSPYNNVKCALCDSVYSSSIIYNQHLENDHKVRIQVEQLTFADKASFENWKHLVETETTAQFIKSRGEKKTKNVNKTYYSCNRSGYYVSKARTRKALKKQGSRKINGRCPASMNVTVNPDSSYDVRFVKTHVGHDFEVKHLDLSDKDRDLIVQKLCSGVTKKEIIKQIRLAIEQQNANAKTSAATASISPASAESPAPNQSSLAGDIPSDVEIIPTASEVVITNSTSTFTATIHAPPNTSIVSNSVTSNCIVNHLINQPTSRLHLATTKDIHNIINSKNLDSKLIRHNYDLNNVEAWINEMDEFQEASSVLFYKSQSERSDRFPNLREDDFMLVIMKVGQAEALKCYGNRCIIMDSTHNIHCEYLQVAALSVIDGDGKGLPVAFLFSTRTDTEVLHTFFTILKDKVGSITTRMMIADELDDFYIAWTKVMNRPTHNLLTPWSVFDDWAKKFDLITNRDKLRRMKKSLRALLTEAESEKFSRSMFMIVEENKKDDEVKEFSHYFQEKYAKNPDLWSNCLRKAHGVSNFQLWKLHEKFKLVYKEGKNSKKLDKYIASFMTLFDSVQIMQLSEMEDKSQTKQKALEDRHKKSVETGSIVYEVAVEPIYWLCPSETSNDVYYEVRQNPNVDPKNCCDLICSSCNSCRHKYKCTCLDYIVNLNMCKHIHRICTICKQ